MGFSFELYILEVAAQSLFFPKTDRQNTNSNYLVLVQLTGMSTEIQLSVAQIFFNYLLR